MAGSSTLLRAAHVFISKINESGVVDTTTGGFHGVGAIDKVANMSAAEYVLFVLIGIIFNRFIAMDVSAIFTLGKV